MRLPWYYVLEACEPWHPYRSSSRHVFLSVGTLGSYGILQTTAFQAKGPGMASVLFPISSPREATRVVQ